MKTLVLSEHERRLLSYLDQRGPSHRIKVVHTLASPDSKIGRHRDYRTGLGGGSSGHAEPLIMGRWCRRLIAAGYVRTTQDERGYYRHHELTAAGRAALREPRS